MLIYKMIDWSPTKLSIFGHSKYISCLQWMSQSHKQCVHYLKNESDCHGNKAL